MAKGDLTIMTATQFRRLALSLPEVKEASHMGHPDFRLRGRIIASLGYPDRGWAVVCLKPDQQRRFVRAEPQVFVPVKGGWGRAGNTNVRLAAAPTAVVREALLAAWWIRAPKRLTADFEAW